MRDYSGYKTLEIVQDGRLLTVSLNRPESLNAVGGGMHEDLEDLWIQIRRDSSVGAVLLRGNGRAFCSGGDVKGMADRAGTEEQNPAQHTATILLGARDIVARMLDVPQPIVCAVRGYAMGLGATLALCADVVIVAEDAVIADTHVNVGLVAGDGGAVIWPLLTSLNTAKYYLMTGDRIVGEQAVTLGLAQRCVPGEELDGHAREIAQRLADGPSLAIRFTKSTVNAIARERLNLLIDTSLALEAASAASADHAEATQAFVERRAPKFTGR